MNSSDDPSNPLPTSNGLTRRSFVKKSALTVGAVTLLGQGVGLAYPTESDYCSKNPNPPNHHYATANPWGTEMFSNYCKVDMGPVVPE